MQVESISSLVAVPLSNIVRAQVSEGSIALPVKSSDVVYANLKNIKGIPASFNGGGYSINRLRALDNMIERLRGLGVEKVETPEPAELAASKTENLDKMVRALQEELNETLNKRIIQYRGAAGLDAGLSLNLLV